jgi:YjbE family integral membrane protein
LRSRNRKQRLAVEAVCGPSRGVAGVSPYPAIRKAMDLGDVAFWIALLQIIGINVVLSGDNAVVIALAARSLPARQQKQAVIWGSSAAVVLRIVLTVVAIELLQLPYLKILGAVLLLWIGIQLLVPEEEHGSGRQVKTASMAVAVRTILLADLVMSLDNVIAVAAAAKGNLVLLIVGLLVSIPLVIFGSTYLMRFMDRWPIIVTLGGALLGWVAGEMAVTDPLLRDWVDASAKWLHYVLPIGGALLVVLIGKWMATRADSQGKTRPVVDLATADDQAARAGNAVPVKLRFLLAADDSEPSIRAVENFIRQLSWYRDPVEVHLLNTQSAVHRDVSTFVSDDEIRAFHHEEGLKALQPVRERLDRAGIPYALHIGVGNAGPVIAHYGKEKQCQQIFMSEHAGSSAEGLLGTVAAEVAHLSEVPVTLV